MNRNVDSKIQSDNSHRLKYRKLLIALGIAVVSATCASIVTAWWMHAKYTISFPYLSDEMNQPVPGVAAEGRMEAWTDQWNRLPMFMAHVISSESGEWLILKPVRIESLLCQDGICVRAGGKLYLRDDPSADPVRVWGRLSQQQQIELFESLCLKIRNDFARALKVQPEIVRVVIRSGEPAEISADLDGETLYIKQLNAPHDVLTEKKIARTDE